MTVVGRMKTGAVQSAAVKDLIHRFGNLCSIVHLALSF